MHTLKSLEELQLTTGSITAILPKILADFVEQEARRARYGRQLLRENRQLVATKGRSVHLPVRGSISAVRVSEAYTPTEQNVSWSATEVTPFKIGTQLYITQESIDGTEVDVINGSIEEAAISLAVREDDEIFNELLGRQPDPTPSAGIWTWVERTDSFTGDGGTKKFTLSLGKPVIQMSTVTVAAAPTTAFKVDYYEGKVEFTSAPVSGSAIVIKSWYSKRTKYATANTDKALKYEDLVAAKTAFRANKLEGDVCVMNPDEYADLLNTDKFFDVSKYGSRETILNGEVGQAAGWKIIVSLAIPSGTVLYLDTRRAGWYVLKRNVDVKRKESQETDSYKFFFYYEFAPKVTDANAVYISVNHAANADATL
jgi:N4-gp56 family major capsid protein